MNQNKLNMLYDLLGNRIIALQDKLAELPLHDKKRDNIIIILAELDDLKREFLKILQTK